MIGGFGLFATFDRLAVWQAWDIFGQGNGTSDEYQLLVAFSASVVCTEPRMA